MGNTTEIPIWCLRSKRFILETLIVDNTKCITSCKDEGQDETNVILWEAIMSVRVG